MDAALQFRLAIISVYGCFQVSIQFVHFSNFSIFQVDYMCVVGAAPLVYVDFRKLDLTWYVFLPR